MAAAPMDISCAVRRPKAKQTYWGITSSTAASRTLTTRETLKACRRVQRMLDLFRSPWKVLTMGCRAMLMASYTEAASRATLNTMPNTATPSSPLMDMSRRLHTRMVMN